jgi:hypothetical protein
LLSGAAAAPAAPAGEPPVLVPFAHLPEGQPVGLGDVWGVALLRFHEPLWMMRCLLMLATKVRAGAGAGAGAV